MSEGLTDAEIIELEQIYELDDIDNAKQHLWDFTEYNFEGLDRTRFHRNYYEILNHFAEGKIKKLMVSISPQHGKSLGSSQMLPPYMLGKNPNLSIALVSYSATQARKFNRKVQRVISTPKYFGVFPDTLLNESENNKNHGEYIQTADEFEIVGHNGSFKAVGRGGALTGNEVDVVVLDDMYKDAQEANSPIIRDSVWDMYTSVVKTRLHNDSQQLMVFTRWHEDDLQGRIMKLEEVVTITSLDDLIDLDPDTWVRINFEALKTGEPTDIDPREKGEPLWPAKHSRHKLEKDRDVDTERFNCLYQGNPISKVGLLYSDFKTYTELPKDIRGRKNHTDTADKGDDYLCSISYLEAEGYFYVIDVLYTQEGMEYTEEAMPMRLIENEIKECTIESNNGGRGFARIVEKKVTGHCTVNWFHQSQNKESRILTNSSLVNKHIIFPFDWATRWPEFNDHLTYYKKKFSANKHDDGPDVLTGIVERSAVQEAKIQW